MAYTAIIQLRHASVFYNIQKTNVGFFKLLNDRRIFSVLPSHRSIRDSNPTVANRSNHKATSINPAWFILHVERLMGYTTRAARLLYPLLYYIFVLLGVKPKGSRIKKLGFLFTTHMSYREFIDHTLQSCLDTNLALLSSTWEPSLNAIKNRWLIRLQPWHCWLVPTEEVKHLT